MDLPDERNGIWQIHLLLSPCPSATTVKNNLDSFLFTGLTKILFTVAVNDHFPAEVLSHTEVASLCCNTFFLVYVLI